MVGHVTFSVTDVPDVVNVPALRCSGSLSRWVTIWTVFPDTTYVSLRRYLSMDPGG